MLFGGQIKKLEHVALLQDLGFDFGEVALTGNEALERWKSSNLRNSFDSDFFLIAHGPDEGPPNDVSNVWERYLPELKDTIDVAQSMEITFLTMHLWVDRRYVKPNVLEEKARMLKEIVRYAGDRGIELGLENLSEHAEDLAPMLEAAKGLTLTLDVGHAQLLTDTNSSFDIINRLGSHIRHLHFHDNLGGTGPADDLHLPPGQGVVDFPGIVAALVRSGYDRTITFELNPEELADARDTVLDLLKGSS